MIIKTIFFHHGTLFELNERNSGLPLFGLCSLGIGFFTPISKPLILDSFLHCRLMRLRIRLINVWQNIDLNIVWLYKAIINVRDVRYLWSRLSNRSWQPDWGTCTWRWWSSFSLRRCFTLFLTIGRTV